jgi:hypothetical protein
MGGLVVQSSPPPPPPPITRATGGICGDGVCEARYGETCNNCPYDCSTVTDIAGNTFCCGQGKACQAGCNAPPFQYCRT